MMYRNISLLALCQAFLLSTTSLTMTSSALVSLELAPDRGLATVPLAISYVTVVTLLIPISLLMQKYGRRLGFLLGAFSVVLGGFLSAVGLYLGQFMLFCAGALFQGVAMASAQFYRFAAVEVATEEYKSRAISWVLLGGLAAALIGPSIAKYTAYRFAVPAFTVTFASVIVLGAGVITCLLFLRLPSPLIEQSRQGARPLARIVILPSFIVAALCAMVAYGSMNLLMTSTPLAMDKAGIDFDRIALVIQCHIVGMFAPSFFTGSLINRFGVLKVMFVGAMILFACTLICLHGDSFQHFLTALVSLGVGWNFLYIGGTTLLTEVYRPAEKGLVQGMNDFLVFSAVALTALLSGFLHNVYGWEKMNGAVIPVVIIAGLSLLLLHLRISRQFSSSRSAG